MSKPKKKILFIFRDYFSRNRGTPLRIKSLIKEIEKDESFEIYSASRDEEVSFGVKHLSLDTTNAKSIFAVNRFIKENNIETVVFHTVAAAYFLLPLLLLSRNYKRVLEMHGFFEEEARLYNDITFLKYYRNKFIYSVIYKMCHLITTCSDTATERLRHYNKNTHTIYGGVDLSLFNTDLNDNIVNSRDTDEMIIGYAGNGRRWQGLEFLLEAFSVLVKRDPSFSLRLLLSEPVRIPDIKNVTVFGALPHDEVRRFNAECDILVIPRLDNIVNNISFPSKLMEYLATGKPVVGSRTSDVHRIITNGETGMLYDPGDIEGFVDCFLKLKDSSLRERIGREGFALVKDKYDWKIQGKAFADLLKKL